MRTRPRLGAAAALFALVAGCTQQISSCDTGDPTAKCAPPIDTGAGALLPELPVGAHARWQRSCGPADEPQIELLVGLSEPTCTADARAPSLSVTVVRGVALTGRWSIGDDAGAEASAVWTGADGPDDHAFADGGSLRVQADGAGGYVADGEVVFGDRGAVRLRATAALDCTAEQPVCG